MTPETFTLATIHGLGDTFFTVGLGQAFREKYCRNGEQLVYLVKPAHYELAEMFGEPIIHLPENEIRSLIQPILKPGAVFCPHVQFVGGSSSWAKNVYRGTQRNTVAMILGLRPSASITLPIISKTVRREAEVLAQQLGFQFGRTVLLFKRANSWPSPTQPSFWEGLTAKLQDMGWFVFVNDESRIPLRYILPICELAGWVIGVNCGIMTSIICGQINCRKTVLTPSGTGYTTFRDVGIDWYDIEEHFVSGADNHDSRIIEDIVLGDNARGFPAEVGPLSLTEPLTSPGEVIDRLTILYVKWHKLVGKRHLFMRDIMMLEEHCTPLIKMYPEVLKKREALYKVNLGAWDANATLISMRDCFDGTQMVQGFKAWLVADQFNQERVRLKNEINRLCGSRVRETKTYTMEETTIFEQRNSLFQIETLSGNWQYDEVAE